MCHLAFQSRAPFSALQLLELTGRSVSEDWVGPQMGLFFFPTALREGQQACLLPPFY